MLPFTTCQATHFAMHRIYTNRINSRGMSWFSVSFAHKKHLAGYYQ